MTARKKTGCLFVCISAGALFAIIGSAVVVGTYNSVAGKSQQADMAWEHVENEYERRVNLTSNLVAAVSVAATSMSSELAEIAEARAAIEQLNIDQGHAPADPAVLARYEAAQQQFATALTHFLGVVDRNADLTSMSKVADLRKRLAGTTGQIAAEIVGFNESVRQYNTSIKLFPGVVMARICGYKPKPLLTADVQAKPQAGTTLNGRAVATMPTQP